jgi:hypothetical protein
MYMLPAIGTPDFSAYSSSKKECECDIIEKKQVDDKNGANGNTENYNCRPQG